MNNDLSKLLIEAGLLQFGWFDQGAPFKLHLDMAPAYPDVLKVLAVAAQPYTQNMSRLVCLANTLPFGVVLSLESDIPLVYSRGSGDAPVDDLVGAYDIGHPALLLVNTLTQAEAAASADLIVGARRVGLEIQHLLAIVQIDLQISIPVADLTVHSLLKLADVVETLVNGGRVPAGQGEAIQAWLAK